MRPPCRLRAAIGSGGEEGFTILELAVALTVIAVGIFGTMQVFLGSLATTTYADSRTRATALAAREVEGMRAASYARLGFAADAPGFVASISEDGQAHFTVVVPAPATTPTGAPDLTRGVSYSIRRDIVWVPVGEADHAFKRVIATVTWTDRAGNHSVRQDAGVYPGGLGVHGGTTTETTAAAASVTPSSPVDLTATQHALTPTSAVDLLWSVGPVAPARWELHYSSNGGASWTVVTVTQPAGTTSFTTSGLSSNTPYLFRLRGISGALASQWVQVSATTEGSIVPCTIHSASVNPASVKRKHGNVLAEDLRVTANTGGSCAGLRVEFPATTVFQVAMVASGNTFTASERGDAHTWAVGDGIIRILSSGGTELATVSLVVTK